MEYIDVDYEELERKGTILKNSLQRDKDLSQAPILMDGLVYKPFIQGIKKKEQLILLLDKLKCEHLATIKGINSDHKGFIYRYKNGPLLCDILGKNIPLDIRLRWIDEILRTDLFLNNNGLTYYDYHSANIVAASSTCLLDEDSIIKATDINRRRIKEYLIELMISIFINKDLTESSDINKLRAILKRYFQVEMEEGRVEYLFDIMCRKSEEEIISIRESLGR